MRKCIPILLFAFFLVSLNIKDVYGSRCDSTKRIELAKQYVVARYCGGDFDDTQVLYREPHLRHLMEKLRAPTISGNFKPEWDSVVIADDLGIKKVRDDGTETRVRFHYGRLGMNEGGGGANAEIFRAFVSDRNDHDSFEILVSNSCEIVDPPVARIHPSTLLHSIQQEYQSLIKVLGDRCKDAPHCQILEMQTESIISLSGGVAHKSCELISGSDFEEK